MAGNQITFGIGFNVNESNLNALKKSLQEIQQLTSKDLIKIGSASSTNQAIQQLAELKKSATEVQNALNKAFNAELGITNIAKLNQELKQLNLGQIATQFNNVGAAGQAAFINFAGQALSTNVQLKQSYTWLTKIGTTLANTIKWNVASTAVNAFANSITSAFNYVKVLDASLTDIRIVTGQSREEMAQFAVEANKAAQSLGRQTKEYTNAALSFYQQGLNDQEVKVRTEASLKAQNITGAGTEITDQLTAVWNGFKATVAETETYVDKLAAVADSSASNLSELATGMSKVASTANNVGVDIDQLTAQLATIIATTRQAPETVGNALKTIYARINDIKTGSDEAEISLGNYTGKMAALGFSVLDANGRLKDTGETITEIGERWATLSKEQQIYLAQTMAGQRQMNNLISLFDNWEKYSEMLNVSLNSQGTLNEKNARYMDSLSAHINQFKTAVEGMQDALIDENAMMDMYDAGAKLMNLFKTFIDSIGGMQGVLVGLGAIGTRVFGEQIADSILTTINNIRIARQEVTDAAAQVEVLQQFNMSTSQYNNLPKDSVIRSSVEAMRELVLETQKYKSVMGTAEQEAVKGLISQQSEIATSKAKIQDLITQVNNYVKAYEKISGKTRSLGLNKNLLQEDQQGIYNLQDFDKAAQKAEIALAKLRAEMQDIQTDAAGLSELTKLQIKLDKLTQSGKGSEEEIAALKTRIADLMASLGYSNIDDFKARMLELTKTTQVFGAQTDYVKKLLNELGTKGNDASGLENDRRILIAIAEAARDCGKDLEKLKGNFQQIPEAVNEVNAATEKYSATLKSLQTLLRDKSFAQGVTQIFQGISSFAMGLQSLISISKTYQSIQEGTTSKTEGWLSIIISSTMALSMFRSSLTGLREGISKVGTAIYEVAISSTALKGTLVGTTAAEMAASEGALTTAGSLKLMGAAAWTAAKSFIAAHIAILGPIAAVATAVGALYLIVTKSERDLAKAEKAAEKSANAYNEVKDKYKELTDTIANYQEARAAIQELTAGTEEWKDAIVKANEEAMKLLKMTPELAEYLREGPEGLYFEQEGLDKAKRAEQQKVTNANMQQVYDQAQVINRRAANVSEITNPLALENLTSSMGDVTEEFALMMVQISNIIQSMEPELYDRLQQIGNDKKQLDEFFAEIGDSAKHPEYIDLKQVLQEAVGLNVGNKKNRQIIVDAFVSNFKEILGYEEEAVELTEGKRQSILRGSKSLAQSLASNLIDSLSEDTQDELENQLPEFQSSFKTAIANKLFKAFKEEDFNEVQNINDNLENFFNSFSNFVADLDTDVLQGLAEFYGGNELPDISNITDNILIKIFEESLSNPQLYEELGFVTEELFENAIHQASDNIRKNKSKIQDKIPEVFQDYFNTAIVGNYDVSIADAKNVVNVLDYFYTNMSDYTEKFKDLQQYGEKDSQAFLDLLIQSGQFFKDGKVTDLNAFTKWLGDIEGGAPLLESIGSTVEEFLNKLKLGAEDTAPSFEKVAGSFTDAKKAADKLDFTDIVDDEDDWSAIMSVLGNDVNKFFITTAGGAHQLMKSGEELNNALKNIQLQKLKDEIVLLQDEADKINEIIEKAPQEGQTATPDWQRQFLTALFEKGLLQSTKASGKITKAGQLTDLFAPGNEEVIQELVDANLPRLELLKNTVQEITIQIGDCESGIRSLNLTLDKDVDAGELIKLADYVSKFKDSLDGINVKKEDDIYTIAQAMLRFKNATEEGKESIEDWKDAFKTGDLLERVNATEVLRESLADLTNQDISLITVDGNEIELLNLYEKAIEGDTEALAKLFELLNADTGKLPYSLEFLANLAKGDLSSQIDKLFEKYRSVQGIADKMKVGSTITKEEEKTLEKFGIDLDKFFKIGSDGLKTFTGDVDEFAKAIENIHLNNLVEEIEKLKKLDEQNQYVQSLSQSQMRLLSSERRNKATASNQLMALSALKEHGLLEDVSDEQLAQWQDAARAGELTASMISKIGIASNNAAREIAILKDNMTDTGEAIETLEAALDAYRNLDKDVDFDEYQQLSKYLQDHYTKYQQDIKAADDMAERMLRFNSAIETVQESTQKWSESSKQGILTQQQTVEDLTNVLSDLFDVEKEEINLEGKDQKNIIKLLKDVAAGNKEAYYELMKALELELDRSWDEITQATDALIDAANRLNSVFSGYASAEGIVGNLKKGSIISAEQGKNLTEYFAESDVSFKLKDYFTQMADGSLQIIGEKYKELQKLVDEVQLDNLEKAIKNTQEAANSAKANIEALNNELNKITDDGVATLEEKRQFLQELADDGYLKNTEGLSMSSDDLSKVSDYGNDLNDLYNYNLDKVLSGTSDYQKAMQDAAEDTRILQEAYDNLQQSMREKELDADVDLENWRNMAEYIHENASELEGLSADLEDSKRASDNLAEAILRFDDAIVDVNKNYKNWKDALDLGAMQDYVDIVDDLKDAYADLLGLDWDDFSDQFLQSVDNLDLLKAATEGSEEAYDQLMQAVQQDIEGQILVNADIDTEAFFAAKTEVENALAEMNFQELEIGASLNDTDFLSACERMVNAAHMTAEQATSYLATMGVDAEVKEHEETVEETQQLPNYTVEMHEVTAPYAIPYGDGSYYQGLAEGDVVNQSQTYVPDIKEITTTKVTKTPTLEVKSANKSSGGGYKYDNASHGGGASNPNRSGGGGGGGGSKPKKPMKPFKSKIDPYHDVNIKIGNVKEGLERLNKQRDKLLGKDAIANLTKQIELMEREKELLQDKADIAKEEASRLQGELGALGAIFEKNGDIANYKELLLDKQNQINNAIAVANSLQGDERDAYEDYISDLKDEYSELEDKISEYDETLQLLDDLDLEYRDIINQQIELAIEAFDLEINVKLDVKDAIEDFNEFRKRIIDQIKEDDYAGQAAAAMNNYGTYYYRDENGKVAGLVGDLYNHTKRIIQESDIIMNGGFSQIYGDNLAAAAEDLKKYNDELMDALESVQDIVDEVHENLLESLDAMQDAYGTQQEAFDKLDDLLQHDMEILQLIHGEENYDELSLLWSQQVEQDEKRLRALQEQQNYWKQKLDQYEKDTDEWKKAMENWQESFEATNEAMINAVKNLQSQWENSINSIMSTLKNQTFGGNMSASLENWDKMVWHSDRYLDSIERASGLLKLQNKYIEAINKTSDPKIQEQLAELEEKQLDSLANKEHLREIDLKIAEQQLTVLQAQLALEDARNAKTKMRLRRDSQGNYTYQYVADEDDIQEKTQDYIDALNEYRSITNDSLREDLEALRDYTLDYYEALQEAQMKYGDDTKTLLEEQDRLYELYFGDDGYITNLHTDAISSMSDAQEAMFINLYGLNQELSDDLFRKFLGPDSEMLTAVDDLLGAGGEIPSLIDAFINDSAKVAFENIQEMTYQTLSGPEGMLPEWSSVLWQIAEQYETEFVPSILEAMTALQLANQTYVDGLAVIQVAANRTTEQIALGLYYDTEYTNALNESTNALIETQKAEVEACEAVYNALKKNQEAFKAHSLAAVEAANANFLYWVSMQGGVSSGVPYALDGISGDYSVSMPSISYPQADYGDYGGGDSGGGGDGGSGGGGGGNTSSYNALNTSYGLSSSDASARTGSVDDDTLRRNAALAAHYSYASGGYTGEWFGGSIEENGRFAMLHQKELVLNEADTKNILSAVDIVRTISDRVNAFANSMLSGLTVGGPLDLVGTAAQTILQDVVINADFPGVEDAAQIKQAFNELVNLASQRASGNRRTY